MSDFSKSPSINNFGPNITIIFIPGAINCPDQARARAVNDKTFGVDISTDTDDDTAGGEAGSSFDCGEMVEPRDTEISCGEPRNHYTKKSEDHKCLWHFYVKFETKLFSVKKLCIRLMKDGEDR